LLVRVSFNNTANRFAGKEAVDWLVEHGHARDRKDAVAVGNMLIAGFARCAPSAGNAECETLRVEKSLRM
jgi:hypothetical protein